MAPEQMRTLLTEIEVVNSVVELFGPDAERRRYDIEAELFRLKTTREALTRLRERRSANAKKALADFRTHLHKAQSAISRLPEDYRILFDAKGIIRWLASQEEYLDKKVTGVEETGDGKLRLKFEPRLEKRSADGKQLAADAALRLLDQFGVEATTTPGGKFETLAALLYGDANAGRSINHHCRSLIRKRKRGLSGERENDQE